MDSFFYPVGATPIAICPVSVDDELAAGILTAQCQLRLMVSQTYITPPIDPPGFLAPQERLRYVPTLNQGQMDYMTAFMLAQ